MHYIIETMNAERVAEEGSEPLQFILPVCIEVETPEDISVERVQEMIDNAQFHQLFDYLGLRAPFRHKIERVRNAQVWNDKAWDDSQSLLTYVIPDYREGMYNLDIIHRLFLANRDRFLSKYQDKAQEAYRIEKREVLGPLSDGEYKQHSKFADIFERGLFQGSTSTRR